MEAVTQILDRAAQGDRKAAEELLPLVYDELKKLAAAKLAQERAGESLNATALVHEAYLRLVGEEKSATRSEVGGPRSDGPFKWDHRGHFFAAAAEAMRRILVDRARKRGRQKHGGELSRQNLADWDVAAIESADELLALDEAMSRLAASDEQAAQLVSLRYFAGLSLPQVAELLGISPRSADRVWAYARAYLHAEIYEK
jgi:RNA polymerase sigma factor (sigma-70 family)